MYSSKIIRLVTLFVILVCLPLQGFAGASMAFCQLHEQAIEIHVEMLDAGDMSHCYQQAADDTTKKTACDKCSTCYLSAAQAITPLNILVDFSGISPAPLNFVEQALDSVSSPPFHPPRLPLA